MSTTAIPSHAAWHRFFERHLEARKSAKGQPIYSAKTSAASALSSIKQTQGGPSAEGAPGGHLEGSVSPTPGADSSLAAGHQPKPRRAKSARNLRSAFRAGGSLGGATGSIMGSGRSPKAITEVEYEQTIKRLCKLVLAEGVPSEDDFALPKGHHNIPPRALVWKLLLDVRTLDPVEYLSLVAKGPSSMHDKICDDANRTLATDSDYKGRVNEEALVRILDAFVWKHTEDKDSTARPSTEVQAQHTPIDDDDSSGPMRFGYVQGMNVLAAPFLYAMPSELEAFKCFCTFIETRCPTYVQPTLVGVHRGMELLDRCLQMADPALASHLRATNLNAELYAFASVLTLCACTPPLKQLLQIWDFLLAFGTHLCVPCVVAQLILMRTELLATTQPMKLLRSLPSLDARSIVELATTTVRDLDEAFYDELVRHATQM